MGLFGSNKSSSSQSSTTTSNDNRVTTAGDQSAPINTGTRNQQANGDGSISAGGAVKVNQEDNRNFGTALDGVKIGNGSTLNVTTADPALAAAAIEMQRQTAQDSLASQAYTAAASLNANVDVSRAALASNLGALEASLGTVNATTADAFESQRKAIEALTEADKRRDRATTEAINAGLDLGRQASASAETITQNALQKLADQRAPDGANLTKIALWVVVALAAVFGLRLLRSRKAAA